MKSRITTTTLLKMKQSNEKIAMLTAYDYPTAKILDECGVDIILVGDSLGMVVLGYENTTQVTMEDMIHHIKAVSRGTDRAMIVGDMPFLSYHISIEQSVLNAGRLIQEGNARAVKLEGGEEIIQDVKAIIKAGIPVMGHLGLTPQSIYTLGGYYVQGKELDKAKKMIEDAKKLEEAGVFAIVLECVPQQLAERITNELSIPTIGIGAGAKCDGQVLVINDILGNYQGKTPKFVKQYANFGENMSQAVKEYIEDVKNVKFPEQKHSFSIEQEVLDKLY